MSELIAIFGIDWKLIVAQTINFLIVLGALTFFLYKPVMKMLTDREQKIAQGIKDAEAAEKARRKIEEEKGAIITSAHRESDEIVTRAQEEAKRERADIVAGAQQRAEDIVLSATKEGEELKRAKLKESESEVARTAILAAEKLIREKLS